ncbi:MAG: hypothetical protein IJ250_07475, partial [Bacteroidales bacterium]|nr:hypothetical protein [Bacteroidales bacterium]
MKIKLNKSVILLLLAGMFAAPKAYSQDAGQGCANVKIKQLINKDTVEFTDAQIKSGIQLTCDTSARKLLPVGFAPGYPDPTKDYYT